MREQKTIKRAILKKRIEDLKLRKNSLVYNAIIAAINKDTDSVFIEFSGKIRPVYYAHRKTVDITQELRYNLRYLGLIVISDNDAPRGGKVGNYLEIKTKIVD